MTAPAPRPSAPGPLRTVHVVRYVEPLREGGSLPGLVEADDLGTYVMKCRAAGQGTAVLVAEVLVAAFARALGLAVPELVVLQLDEAIGRREPDPEVQDLLVRSTGTNLGMDFLPGAVGYEPALDLPELHTPEVVAAAARTRWLDAFTGNVDRSSKNPNLLVWHRAPWLIDHGAALVFHHGWPPAARWAGRVYDASDHVYGPLTAHLTAEAWQQVDAAAHATTTADDAAVVRAAVAQVPDDWLLSMNAAQGDPRPAQAWRDRYVEHLTARLAGDRPWRPGAAR